MADHAAAADAPFAGIYWDPRSARVSKFTTVSAGAGVTAVRVELRVTSPWELGDLMRRLAELRDGSAKPKGRTHV